MATPFRKLLPYTTFVAAATYYSNLFSVELWDDQPPDLSFVDLVQNLLPKDQDDLTDDAVRGIQAVAASVDQLERDLLKDNLRRADFGLGHAPPRPLADIKAPFVRPFFLTLLLDRLYWAFTYDPSEPLKITLYEHPDHAAPPIPKPAGAKEYLELSPEKLQENISRHQSACNMVESHPIEWGHGPSALITEAGDSGCNQDMEVDSLSPGAQDQLVKHANTIAHAAQLSAVSRTIQVTSNICALAASSLFLMSVSLFNPLAAS